ncbi:MAG: hypothetical protein U0W40_13280 [Acidimicrobiia bacterium]
MGALIVAVNLGGSGGDEPVARDEVWSSARRPSPLPCRSSARAVAGTAFGSVVGAPGKVWMYEPGTRQVGYYDTATSKVVRLRGAPVAPTTQTTQRLLPGAWRGTCGWSRRRERSCSTTRARSAWCGASTPTATSSNPDVADMVVVAGGRVVVAASGRVIQVHVVDPATGKVAAPSFGTGDPNSFTDLAADGRFVVGGHDHPCGPGRRRGAGRPGGSCCCNPVTVRSAARWWRAPA